MTQKINDSLMAIAASAVFAGTLAWAQPAAAVNPYLGQIDYFAFNFNPRGWALCDGQILPINSYQSLYSLLGTTFGGDGRSTFGLPDMRGRIPIHPGTRPGGASYTWGQKGGAEQVTLAAAEIPSHTHTLRGTTATGNQVLPTGNALADDAPDETYRDEAPNADMRAGSIGSTPSQGHENMPPFLVINCSIALQGLFPSRN